MRTRPPSIRVDGPVLTVRIEVVGDDGVDLPALEVTLSDRWVDWLVPTATPALPLLAAVAAARGEIVSVGGSADVVAARAADTLARRLAQRWGRGTAGVKVDELHTAPLSQAEDLGLLFDRGVAAWAALLGPDRTVGGPAPLAEGPNVVSYLIVVGPADPSPVSAAIRAGHDDVARAGGLVTVDVTTTAGSLLEAVGAPEEARELADLSAALVVGMGVRRIVVPNPIAPDLLAALSPGPDLGDDPADRTLVEQVALIAVDPIARTTVRPCTDGSTAHNCGRCPSCLIIRSLFVLVGWEGSASSFTAPLDLAAVRETTVPPALATGVDALVEGLPPEHEALRRAWVDARARSRAEVPDPRWGDWDVPGLAGPGVPQRVATALRSTTGTPDAPAVRPLGWRPGTVPLRPAMDTHIRIRARAAHGPFRDKVWAVVEHHIRADDQDGQQAALALRCLETHGPGLVYLPGILWAPEQPPALDPEAVSRLLGAARVRLWWRPHGDLEPLRVVESVEHGCLPLQVMPAGPARDLRNELPPALAALVVADHELSRFPFHSDAVADRLATAIDLLLAGAAEHDLPGAIRA